MSRRVRRQALVVAAVITLALFLVLLAACPARADDTKDADAPPAPTWYGWQTLINDGAAFFFAFGSTATGSTAVAAYGLGGPIVHLIHDRPEAALASVALRVALPAAGYAIGTAIDCSEQRIDGLWTCRDHVTPTWGAILALAGIPAAMAIDSAVLARAPAPAPPSRFVQYLSPAFAPRPEGGFDVKLQGAF